MPAMTSAAPAIGTFPFSALSPARAEHRIPPARRYHLSSSLSIARNIRVFDPTGAHPLSSVRHLAQGARTDDDSPLGS
jgi:hypothetical protein